MSLRVIQMRCVPALAALAIVALAAGEARAQAHAHSGAQARGSQILFDESGRQIEDPRDRRPARRGHVADAPADRPGERTLGRIDNVTVGVTTQSKLKAGHEADIRSSLDPEQREQPPRFLGLSLSVPTQWWSGGQRPR